MNNDNEIDHEYVLVEFHNNNIHKSGVGGGDSGGGVNVHVNLPSFQIQDDYNNDDEDVLTMDIDDYNNNDDDDDDDWDEDSYVQCFEDELSLTPSVTASVCSETMFGELSSLGNKRTGGTRTTDGGNSSNDKMIMTEEVDEKVKGKPRSCSIVSLHDEEDGPVLSNQNNMDMDVDDPQQEGKEVVAAEKYNGTPFSPSSSSKVTTTVVSSRQVQETVTAPKVTHKFKATLKKGLKNDSSIPTTATSSSQNAGGNSVGGSRLSNKKRRKKMKQMKKAAALAAFTTMKQAPPTTAPLVTNSTPISAAPPPSSSSSSVKQTKVVNKNNHTNIAVICAREALISYEEEMKRELLMKKKANGGTLNFHI